VIKLNKLRYERLKICIDDRIQKYCMNNGVSIVYAHIQYDYNIMEIKKRLIHNNETEYMHLNYSKIMTEALHTMIRDGVFR
jgi:hypothetical protein